MGDGSLGHIDAKFKNHSIKNNNIIYGDANIKLLKKCMIKAIYIFISCTYLINSLRHKSEEKDEEAFYRQITSTFEVR